MPLETDYLVIGAGATALAFTDELIAHGDAHVTLVDRRDAPGGHWNDVYPFVRLHQPATFYGVGSRELSNGRIDADGFNAGLMSLSEGPEIVHYFHAVLHERLLPSGRVRFLPMTEVMPDGSLRHRLSGARTEITVRRKVVDAGHLTNSVPRTHTRAFSVADGVACVPPGDLPLRAAGHRHFTVLGGGKTAADACTWLLSNGAPADAITWVVPRDAWFIDRANTQTAPQFFERTFASLAAQREAMAAAESATDLAHRLEACGAWMRLDPSVEPAVFHYATLSRAELDALRGIRAVLRLGRVTAATPGRLVLERGEASVPPDTLLVDCTASALTRRAPRPVFDGARITLQMIRMPQPCFSAACIAFLEAEFDDDAARNACTRPITMFDTVADYPVAQMIDQANRFHAARQPALRDWMLRSRLDGYAHLVAAVDPSDAVKTALLERVRAATKAAMERMPRWVGR